MVKIETMRDRLTSPTRTKTTYTFNEAIELMKLMDNEVTINPIQWVDTKTGKPVSIGYSR